VRRVKILFTSTLNTPFIQQDLSHLRRHFESDHLLTIGLRAPAKIFSAVRHSDVTFTWFASSYAYCVVQTAAALGKPSILVVGGVDAARMPEIGYGIWLNPWKSILVGSALRKASRVLVVDESLRERVCGLARYGGENIRVLPTGYDAAFWRPEGSKDPEVLTVAACHDRPRFLAKGVDRFIECARHMPDVRFRLIGLGPSLRAEIRDSLTSNLELLPYLQPAELRVAYQRARVYCQLSRSEGFPNSVCEAMLCGCVPVGTAVGGIPTAVGAAGYLVSADDTDRIVETLRDALVAPESVATRARERIAGQFSSGQRERGLVEAVNEVTS
jgi:glycosyltransferase involved in cell wall biosynthesis